MSDRCPTCGREMQWITDTDGVTQTLMCGWCGDHSTPPTDRRSAPSTLPEDPPGYGVTPGGVPYSGHFASGDTARRRVEQLIDSAAKLIRDKTGNEAGGLMPPSLIKRPTRTAGADTVYRADYDRDHGESTAEYEERLRRTILGYMGKMGRLSIALFGDKNNVSDEVCITEAATLRARVEALTEELCRSQEREEWWMDKSSHWESAAEAAKQRNAVLERVREAADEALSRFLKAHRPLCLWDFTKDSCCVDCEWEYMCDAYAVTTDAALAEAEAIQ